MKKNSTLQFTNREMEVLRLICDEYTSQEIAEMLGISKRTIEVYRNRLLKKIKAKNVVSIVLYALRTGIYKI